VASDRAAAQSTTTNETKTGQQKNNTASDGATVQPTATATPDMGNQSKELLQTGTAGERLAKESLYEPWLVVDTRRQQSPEKAKRARVTQPPSKVVSRGQPALPKASGSRFEPLESLSSQS